MDHGATPIVRTSPLYQLYKWRGLPVAIVTNWGEITEERLGRWNKKLVPLLGKVRRKVSNDYWTDWIRDKAHSLSPSAPRFD